MKGGADPPLPQGVKEDVVWRPTLVPVELVKQPVTFMKLLWVLRIKIGLSDYSGTWGPFKLSFIQRCPLFGGLEWEKSVSFIESRCPSFLPPPH